MNDTYCCILWMYVLIFRTAYTHYVCFVLKIERFHGVFAILLRFLLYSILFIVYLLFCGTRVLFLFGWRLEKTRDVNSKDFNRFIKRLIEKELSIKFLLLKNIQWNYFTIFYKKKSVKIKPDSINVNVIQRI